MDHDRISVIVSRVTSLIENFVICCYQVTEFFCTRYCFTSALPARSPRNLGSLAFAMSIFWEVSCHFRDVPHLSDEKVFASAGTSASSRLSVNSFNHFGRSRNQLLVA